MTLLVTEQPQYHLVCNTDKTWRVHVSKEGQDWQVNSTLSALLGAEQDVHRRMQLANLAFRCMFGLCCGSGTCMGLTQQ